MFNYRELRAEIQEIRLLKLFPATDFTAEIECGLVYVPLNSSAVYDALSYTWGDATDRLPIWINGHKVSVTRNLESALRNLRKEKEERLPDEDAIHEEADSWLATGGQHSEGNAHEKGSMHKWNKMYEDDDVMTLWVDAICINQSDIPERNSQVRQMAAIYRGAKAVRVWLGEAGSVGPDLFDDLWELIAFINLGGDTSAQERMSGMLQRFGLETEMPDGNVSNMTERMQKKIQDLGRLLQRPWWQRVWVVQEVVLPKRGINLHCGRMSTLWITFDEVIKIIAMTVKGKVLGGFANGHALLDAIRNDEPGTEIEEGPLALTGFVMMTFINDIKKQIDKERPLSLLNLVQDSRFFLKATDPRDHIYGFLGLASNPDAITPDYSKSLDEVYRQFTKAMIEENQTLDILSDCRLSDDRKFPSWVPDWTREGPRGLPMESALRNGDRLYRANWGLDNTVGFEDNLRILKVKAISCDTIRVIGEEAKFPKQKTLHVAQQWLEIFAQYFPCVSPYSDNSGGNRAILEVFWRTICTDDQGNSTRSAPERFGEEFYAAMGSKIPKSLMVGVPICTEPLVSSKAPPTGQITLLGCIYVKANGRRFFITQNNYVGLAPAESRVGDEVFVLLGVSVPFILRPEDNHYLVVGEAYVHGLMHGEAIRKMNEGEAELRDIDLH